MISRMVFITSCVSAFTSSVCLKLSCFTFSTSTISSGCCSPSFNSLRFGASSTGVPSTEWSLLALRTCLFRSLCFLLRFSASGSSFPGAGASRSSYS
uniref:Putative secreted peptide n=1 Tax=Anopheles braziliensis TaxID=58242 RepID=A0A2M3ZVV0_9DIPT